MTQDQKSQLVVISAFAICAIGFAIMVIANWKGCI